MVSGASCGDDDKIKSRRPLGRREDIQLPFAWHVSKSPGSRYADASVSNAQWAPCSENAFGAFIHVTLQEGLAKGLSQCGFQLAVSAAIQGIYGYELLLALPLPLGSSESGFCSSVPRLQPAQPSSLAPRLPRAICRVSLALRGSEHAAALGGVRQGAASFHR